MPRRLRFVMAVLLSAAPAHADARLDQPNGMVDGGVMAEGQKKLVRIPIRNTGDTPFFLGRIEAGCHCSAPGMFTDVIAPGATEWLGVTFDASGLAGELDRTIEFYERGITEPALVAHYRILIERIFTVTPELISVSRKSPRATFRVARQGASGRVARVVANDRRVGAKLRKIDERTWEVDVTLRNTKKTGPFMAVVTLHTDHPASPEVGVLVSAQQD